ncbi:heat shock protein C [Shigella dysenteriae 1012]|nr:heat shock protein C [Shigella dysenteriae 1012]
MIYYSAQLFSAYPISEKQKGKSVKFFTIAYNLLRNKQLPQPSK